MGFYGIPVNYNALLALAALLATSFLYFLFILRHQYRLSTVAVALVTTDMPETCIGFGDFGARVMIENNEEIGRAHV